VLCDCCLLFDIFTNRWIFVIVSNLSTMILIIRTILDMGSISTEVIPEDNPVVVSTETESKSESQKFSLSI
jgi:hypothetical protein